VLLFNKADRGVHDRMRDSGHVPSSVLRAVWERLANDSRGRRRVPLDAGALAQHLGHGIAADSVAQAIRRLQERGVLPPNPPLEGFRVRVLASPLRLECERSALSAPALVVLHAALGSAAEMGDWRALNADGLGLAPHLIQAAVTELESRQLVFVDQPPCRVMVDSAPRSRNELERTIHELKKRHEVERAKLNLMVGYAVTRTCRRKYILEYFGEKVDGRVGCGECDLCDPDR
jgi:hypothetical protein